eukprot:m.182030 g.182030  ORF g.182030 m.182030 type:complete len:480 (-) comp32093_c0_seq2:80-1519(-)
MSMRGKRRFYGDVLTQAPLFYHVAISPVHSDRIDMSAADRRTTLLPHLQHNSTMVVLAADATDVDGWGGDIEVNPDPTVDSIKRFFEEWFPTKREFKEYLRDYVKALKTHRSRAQAQQTTNAVSKFQDLQKMVTLVGKNFSQWRFYRTTTAGVNVGVAMPILRCDISQSDSLLPLCGECQNEKQVVGKQGSGQEKALFHLWGDGLAQIPDPRDLTYSKEQVEIIRLVGQGHPSEVFEARVNGVIVAAKRLKDWKKTAGGSLRTERDWLLAFDHHNILPYLGSVVDDTSGQILYVLTEFMMKGRLSDVCRLGPLPVAQVLAYSLDIALGLRVLHEQVVPVMHRDLHSDNILITTDRAVIADLGSAKEVYPGARHSESLIMYKYIKPPEVLRKSSVPGELGALYSTPFDIWAMGCMMIGMVLGIPCIETRDETLRPSDLQLAGKTAPMLHNLVSTMLHDDPQRRPLAHQIVHDLKDMLKKM